MLRQPVELTGDSLSYLSALPSRADPCEVADAKRPAQRAGGCKVVGAKELARRARDRADVRHGGVPVAPANTDGSLATTVLISLRALARLTWKPS